MAVKPMDIQVNISQQVEIARQQQVVQQTPVHQQEQLGQKNVLSSIESEREVMMIEPTFKRSVEERDSTRNWTPFWWKKKHQSRTTTHPTHSQSSSEENLPFKDPYRGHIIDEFR